MKKEEKKRIKEEIPKNLGILGINDFHKVKNQSGLLSLVISHFGKIQLQVKTEEDYAKIKDAKNFLLDNINYLMSFVNNLPLDTFLSLSDIRENIFKDMISYNPEYARYADTDDLIDDLILSFNGNWKTESLSLKDIPEKIVISDCTRILPFSITLPISHYKLISEKRRELLRYLEKKSELEEWYKIIESVIKKTESKNLLNKEKDLITIYPLFREAPFIYHLSRAHYPVSSYISILDNSWSMNFPGSILIVKKDEFDYLKKIRKRYPKFSEEITNFNSKVKVDLEEIAIIPTRIEELFINVLRNFRFIKIIVDNRNKSKSKYLSKFEFVLVPLNWRERANIEDNFKSFFINNENEILNLFLDKDFILQGSTPLVDVTQKVIDSFIEGKKFSNTVLVIYTDGGESYKDPHEIVNVIMNPVLRCRMTVLISGISNEKSFKEVLDSSNLEDLVEKLGKRIIDNRKEEFYLKNFLDSNNDLNFIKWNIKKDTIQWIDKVDNATPRGMIDAYDDYQEEMAQILLKYIIKICANGNISKARDLWSNLKIQMNSFYELLDKSSNYDHSFVYLTKRVLPIVKNIESIRLDICDLLPEDEKDLSLLNIRAKNIILNIKRDGLDELDYEVLKTASKNLGINDFALLEKSENERELFARKEAVRDISLMDLKGEIEMTQTILEEDFFNSSLPSYQEATTSKSLFSFF